MLDRTRKLIQQNKTVRLVAYGDSISEAGRTPGWFGGASRLANNWAQRLGALLRAAHPRAGFDVINFGIGGQNTYEGLGRLDWLAPLNPDLVIIEFGANDTGWHLLQPDETYTATKFLVDSIVVRHNADVVMLGEGGDNPQSSVHQHLAETIAAQRRVAEECGLPFVDLRSAIVAATDNGRRWTDFHSGPQDCHPNDRGHAVWAEAAFKLIAQILSAPA